MRFLLLFCLDFRPQDLGMVLHAFDDICSQNKMGGGLQIKKNNNIAKVENPWSNMISWVEFVPLDFYFLGPSFQLFPQFF